ncbi:MAG: endonuclease, partial [Subtercola sp.]|nr:endonuclease [Subtercola sp.]
MNETTTESPGMSPGTSPGDRMHELIRELEVLGGFRSAAPIGLADGSVAGLSDEDALAGLVLAERLGKLADSVRVTFAADIHARCGVERGDERLSVTLGFATSSKLIAACTGTSVATASDRVKLGRAVHPVPSWGGGVVASSKFPHVQAALVSGELGFDTAEVITRRLSQAAKQIGFSPDLEAAEEYLVQAAAQTAGGLGFTANQIDALALNLRDRLDPDGVEPRDKRLNEQRSLRFFPLPSGMTKLIGLLPPEDAASWLAIDAATQSPRIRPSFPPDGDASADAGADSGEVSGSDAAEAGAGGRSDVNSDSAGHDPATGDSAGHDPATGEDGPGAGRDANREDEPVDVVFADSRTPAQKRADVFTDLIRKAATLPDVPRLNGAAATISVHADLDDLTSGRGVGWVPGITEPLPASTVQQVLCHADIRTTVFGPAGQVLCQ